MMTIASNLIFAAARDALPARYAEALAKAISDGTAVHGLLPEETAELRATLIDEFMPNTPEFVIGLMKEEPRFFTAQVDVERIGEISPLELCRLSVIRELAFQLEQDQLVIDTAQFALVDAKLLIDRVDEALSAIYANVPSARKRAEVVALRSSYRDFDDERSRFTLDPILSDLNEPGLHALFSEFGLQRHGRELNELATFARRFPYVVLKGKPS